MATGSTCEMDELDVEIPECKALPGFYSCAMHPVSATAVRTDFSNEGSRSVALQFALNDKGQRICCGMSSADYCPFPKASAAPEDMLCYGQAYVSSGDPVIEEVIEEVVIVPSR